jgi:hypothetical protein
MIAYVTTIGEPTTDLCVWSLKRNGFDVKIIDGQDSLASKLKRIYKEANELDCDFVRVDADIIVNRNFTPEAISKIEKEDYLQNAWWLQFVTFDWYKLDTSHSMSYIKKQAVPYLNQVIDKFQDNIRPETESSRIYQFYNPRRFETYDKQIMGIHGYGIKNIKPVIKLKANRGQSDLYDFELAERLNQL